MRRSDSAAQRGTTSISRTAPPGSPRVLGFPPGGSARTAGTGGVRRMGPSGTGGLRRTALAGNVVVDLPARRETRPAGEPRDDAGHPLAALAAGFVRLDRRGLGVMRSWGRDVRVAWAVRVLGLAGEHAGVWMAVGAAGAAADGGRRTAWLRATAVVGSAHLLSMGAKRVVRRPRPPRSGALVRTAGRHSFPSSHAASSAAAVTAFGALLPGTPVVPVLAAAICASRAVAGVHYPSDVVCGALLGAAAARAGRTWALGGGSRG